MAGNETNCINCGGTGEIEGYSFPKSSPKKKRKIIVPCKLCGGTGKMKPGECQNHPMCAYRMALQETIEIMEGIPDNQKKIIRDFIENACKSNYGYVTNEMIKEPIKCAYFRCKPCESKIEECGQIKFIKKYDIKDLGNKILRCLESPENCIYSPQRNK
ncbi:MAG: hypothetical protein WA063_04535 [Minisyncoccia bacterium]